MLKTKISSQGEKDARAVFARDVTEGLAARPKHLPSRYFYDERGDKLFQQIMKMPEYYLTGCEFEILQTNRKELLDHFSPDGESFHLVELGAGDGFKTKVLLSYFLEREAELVYQPVDISSHVLELLSKDLQERFPGLKVDGLNMDYFRALDKISSSGRVKKVLLFMGANIGNFTHNGAERFLSRLAGCLSPGDLLLTGFDLKKDPLCILNAYNDKTGITRAFNLNLLHRINRELDGDFDPASFIHYPTYDPVSGEAKSYLISTKDQTVHIGAIGKSFHFSQWESMQTEVSHKYDLDEIEEMAAGSGFSVVEHFFDCRHYFVNTLWTPDI